MRADQEFGELLARRIKKHYDGRAAKYDLKWGAYYLLDLLETFLSFIKKHGAYSLIFDGGCGPGRDARKPDLEEDLAVLMLKLIQMNAQYSSLEVEAKNFLAELPKDYRIFEEKELKIRVREVRKKIDNDKNEKKQLRL